MTILRLATTWGFPSVRQLAVSHLKETAMDVMQKIKIFQDYKVPRSDIFPCFVELASREKLLDAEEFGVLEDDTKFCIARARETLLRASLSVEGDGPVTNVIERLNIGERSRIVGEAFGISPSEIRDSEFHSGANGGVRNFVYGKHDMLMTFSRPRLVQVHWGRTTRKRVQVNLEITQWTLASHRRRHRALIRLVCVDLMISLMGGTSFRGREAACLQN